MTQELEVVRPKKRKKRSASLEKRKARGGWIFVMPFVIGFVLIYLPIIFDSLYLTFTEEVVDQATRETLNQWVWFKNYEYALLTDDEFVQVLFQGLQNMLFDIPMILMFSLFMAVLLNQKMAGRAVFRAIFFIPVILSTGLMEVIEAGNIIGENMESAEGMENGMEQSASSQIVSSMDIQQLFGQMAVGQELVEYVAVAINNIYNIVNRSGVQMLIFLSGLQSISPAIYESVQIDGATAWETFWKITFPMISPMILVNAVYTVIDSFTTNSNVVMSYITRYRNQENALVASAMSWIYFLIVILIIAVVALIFSSFVFYQRRD